MADDPKNKRRGAGAGIGELSLLRGKDRAASSPSPEAAPPPSRRPAARSSEPLLRAEVHLPEQLIAEVRAKLRPQQTGHGRTIGVPLLLQAYIRAVHDLDLDLDLHGLAPGSEDEATARVAAALKAR